MERSGPDVKIEESAPQRIPDGGRFAVVWPRSAFGRARLALLVSLTLLAAGAWALTLLQPFAMSMSMGLAAGDAGGMSMDGMEGMSMDGMAGPEPSVGDLLAFLAVWTIMMTAMMLPAAAPMILIFASAQSRQAKDTAVPTWLFVAGYLLVWAAAGLLVYAILAASNAAVALLPPTEHATWARLVLGTILILAGAYQFAPLKHTCLSHCRSPFGFVAQYWRDGRAGALGMGVRHGTYCLGCCWALFAVLVGAGVMSLAWMLVITVIVFAEKVLPHARPIVAATGVLMIVIGAALASGIVPMRWFA